MSEPEKLTPKQFEAFREFIYRQSGIRMDVSKITLCTNRIRRRLRAGGFADFDAYYHFLTSPGAANELELFLDAVTTNETHFFRTPGHFDWFKSDFIGEMVRREREGEHGKSLRIWSAACSSGEEAYSLAICLAENAKRIRDWNCKVVGTDISEAALREARAAVYKERALAEVEPALLRRYFETVEGGDAWGINAVLRGHVEFRRHNLMTPLRVPPFDCIFIRNVLIYFDRESKKVVIENLIRSLARGGYLVVGPSEGIYDMLEPLKKCSTFLYQKVA